VSQVKIHNRLGQKVDVPLQDAAGKPISVPLGPYAEHGPVDAKQVSSFTRGLEQAGRIRIRPV